MNRRQRPPTGQGCFKAVLLIAAGTALCQAPTTVLAAGGTLKLMVVDAATGDPLPARVHLRDARGKPRGLRPFPFWFDHLSSDGRLSLRLPLGEYEFDIERGPEYVTRSGKFAINAFADDAHQADLRRVVDMAAEGWYSGDLDVRRPVRDIERILRADDLRVAEVVTWRDGRPLPRSSARAPVDDSLLVETGAGLIQTDENSFAVFRAMPEREPPAYQNELPRDYAAGFSEGAAWIDAYPCSWDFPLWIALGQVDSVRIADEFLVRQGARQQQPIGKPRDELLFPGPQGQARWAHEIYFHMLNCGLRIPPTAGSGTGAAPNPAGYNRVYGHLDGPLAPDAWWNAIRSGRVMVTNGPLMRPIVEGETPGHVFHLEDGEARAFQVGLQMAAREKIAYLEIIQNGRVGEEFRLEEYTGKSRLPPVRFEESGWFLVRAVTENLDTYRFGMTGPYYVEVGTIPRISKRSAEFFLDWTTERASRLRGDATRSRLYEPALQQSLEYWRGLVESASAP